MNRRTVIIASIGIGVLTGAIRAVVRDDPNPEAGAKDAEAATRAFKHDAGLKATVFATEPLLANPVSFSTDERGRWFVTETYRQEGRQVDGKPIVGGVVDNRGHMNWLDSDIAARTTDDRLAMMRKFYPDPKQFAHAFEKYEERIVRIEDSNGDGRADKTTVFADGFRDALDGTGAGILARGGEVWWTCIPNLWRFTDKDGDGKSDSRDKLLSGFGVKFAFRGHDMHGLRFGPDGKLYWTIGDRALNVKSREGRAWEVSDTGAVLRANPDGSDFEVFATGLRNPQELAFDAFGDLFTGDNNSDGGDAARFLQIAEGGDYGWRMTYQYLDDRGPWNRELLWDQKEAPKARYIIPPIANVSNGPAGLTYNPGTGLGKKYAGSFFLSDFRGGASASVVHEIKLEPAGAWHRLKKRDDFVKGILTSDVEFGTDGALYVLDWVESWSGVNKGRIFKFTSADADAAKQAEVKKLLAEGMAARADAELESLLAHEDQRIRQAAQFQLAAKGAQASLAKVAQKGESTLARVHGIWGLGQLAKPEALAIVAPLLADGDGEVRAQAARVLGDKRVASANDQLTAMLADASPRARFHAAIALGKVAHKGAVAPLFAMLADNADKDPLLRHAAIMGLAGCADPEQLAAKTGDPNPAIRGAAVVALRRQRSPQVAAFLRDTDEKIVLEAARAIYDGPIDAAMPALGQLLGDPRITIRNIILRIVNAHYRIGQPENARALATYAANPNSRESGRREALDALAEWGNPNPKDRLTFQWRPLPARTADAACAALSPLTAGILKDAPGSVKESAASAMARLGIGDGEALAAVVANDKVGSSARIESLHALVSLKDSRLATAAKHAAADRDPKLRAAGLKALVTADSAAALKAITDVLSSTKPALEKQGAIVALAGSDSPEAEKLLGSLMDDLVSGKLAPEVQLDVYDAAKKRTGLADKVQQWRGTRGSGDLVSSHQLSLFGGDAERGKKIFRDHPLAQCFKCHKCEGGDSPVGPELTNVGSRLDRARLLESIVEPSKTISPGFQIVVLALADGATVAGRLIEEKDGKLKVETVDSAGKPVTVDVPAAKVKTRTSAPSPMDVVRPLIESGKISRSELRDIIEYLATRK
jgi:quinoprotein glucose dehydrogenase